VSPVREPAVRETDTMDTSRTRRGTLAIRGSLTPDQPFDPVQTAKWMPVDQYIGGVSSTRSCNLLYARFYVKALIDLGIAPGLSREPFAHLFTRACCVSTEQDV